MLESVPTNVKYVCGGLVNTAFQIGLGVSLALAAAVVNAVDIKKRHTVANSIRAAYFAALVLLCVVILVRSA